MKFSSACKIKFADVISAEKKAVLGDFKIKSRSQLLVGHQTQVCSVTPLWKSG